MIDPALTLLRKKYSKHGELFPTTDAQALLLEKSGYAERSVRRARSQWMRITIGGLKSVAREAEEFDKIVKRRSKHGRV